MQQSRPVLSYVVNSLNLGGTERLVVDMSRALRDRFAIDIVCLDEPGVWADDVRRDGILVTCLWRQPGLDLGLASRLAQHFRRRGTQVIHAHQCTPWFYSALSRLVWPRPRLLFEEHGRFFPEPDKPLRRLVNRLIIRRLTHRVVAVSQDVRERLVRYEGLDSDAIEVVYNGVRAEPPIPQQERQELRTELGFKESDFVVGTVGRFDAIKNLPMLIGAVEAAGAENTAVRGLLVGDGPEFVATRSLLEKHSLQNLIRLAGYRADARRLVQCMDLFVLSSLSEGTSMALLEAMAGHVPVAVTDVGGNPEVVLKSETGWVVASGATEQLASVIEEACRDSVRRERFAREGRRRFDEHFAFSTMLDAYIERYGELLAGSG